MKYLLTLLILLALFILWAETRTYTPNSSVCQDLGLELVFDTKVGWYCITK